VFEERASANLRQLDERARSLLSDITIERARDLVRDVAQQEAIRSLAQEITLFESNRLFFAEKFALTPHCRFIRGVYSHLMQDFTDAIKEWETIRIDEKSSKLLVGLASYWIGVEYDTLGIFEKAISTFESARNAVDGVARYDIERLIMESTFSKLPIEDAEKLISPLSGLLTEANKEGDSRAKTYVVRRINIALGNILLQVGKHKKRSDSDLVAESYFRKSEEKFRTTSEDDQWALLGLAETLYYLGRTDEAQRIFTRTKENAETEYRRRKERRSQVLAKTAELISCVRVPKLRDYVEAVHETLTQTLIEVHPRLTVYSAFQKRNVSKDAFEVQLKEFMREYSLGLDEPLEPKPRLHLAPGSE
jgi:tetratricopeptide (TPR) repeat protein